MKKKLFFAMLCLGVLLGCTHPQMAYATEEMISNQNSQDYSKWATVVNDYLVRCSNGQYMSVQGTDNGIYVQYYDNNVI